MRHSALFFIVLLFLLACKPAVVPQLNVTNIAKTECNPPYHEYTKGDCCLDADKNNICDRDEPKQSTEMVINKTVEPPARSIMSDIVIKFRKVVDSYSFYHGKTQYFIKGDYIRIKLDEIKPLEMKINSTRVSITDVYVERQAKKAVGYCDPRTEEEIMGSFHSDRSKCLKLINKEIPLDFEAFNPMLPEDWLKRFSYAPPTRIEDTDQYVKDITGWKTVNPVLYFADGKNEVILRLDSVTGLPVKIETKEPDKTKIDSYTWLVYNSVKPEDLTYQPFTQ